MNKELKDIVVLDIETVSTTRSLGELSQPLQQLWKKKAQFIRNPDDLSEEELYFDRGAIYSEFGKVIVIAIGIFYEIDNKEMGLRVKSFAHDDEKKLLSEFTTFIESKFDPANLKLCTHNGKEFDFPYLCRRMLVNGIKIPSVLDLSGKKPWEVPHIDTMEMWKFGDHKNFTSLDLLANLFGIESSKSHIDGSQVNKIYYSDNDGLSRIAEYCSGDVVTTAQLYLKLKNLTTVEKSNITILRNE